MSPEADAECRPRCGTDLMSIGEDKEDKIPTFSCYVELSVNSLWHFLVSTFDGDDDDDDALCRK